MPKNENENENNRLFLIGRLSYCAETKDWKRFEQLLKDYELSTYKQGMTDSAELIGNVTILQRYGFVLPFKDTGHDYESVKQAILTARDNKKEL